MSGTGYGGPVTEKERARITGDTRGLAIGVEEHGRSSDADAAGRPTQSENNGYAESGYDGGAQRGDDEEAGLVGRGAQLAATRRRDAQLWQGALALLIYAMSSSSLTFVNKTVLSTYDFHCTFLLLAVQLTFAIAVCSTASILPESCASLRPPKVTAQLLRESAKVSVCFVGNIAAGFYGLRVVNLPMFFCVRRTAVVFVLAAEVLFLKKKARADMLLAVVLIVAGTITAGLQDLNADLFGYGCVMVNNAMTALYLAVSKRFTMSTGVNALGLLYLNALVALPLCLIVGYALGEFEVLAQFDALYTPGFSVALVMSSILGIVLTWALFSATSVTGVLKDVGTTALSMVVFAGFNTSFLSVLGVCTSLAGGAWFSAIKWRAARSERK